MKTLDVPEIKSIDSYWFDYNPALSHFMSSLSVLFPEGEKFFMKSMNKFKDKITYEKRKELNEFCRQEINHSKVHVQLNNHLDTKFLLRELEKDTGIVIDRYTRFLTNKQKLAVTVCLEHLTAVMGKHLLERKDLQGKMRTDVKKVWLYHAAEEVEHAHVSFDIYKMVGGSYLLRTGLMIPATIMLAGIVLQYWFKIMNYDSNEGFLRAVYTLIGKNGFFTEMKSDYFAWFKKDFHPTQI